MGINKLKFLFYYCKDIVENAIFFINEN